MIVCDFTWCDSNVFLPLASCGFSEQTYCAKELWEAGNASSFGPYYVVVSSLPFILLPSTLRKVHLQHTQRRTCCITFKRIFGFSILFKYIHQYGDPNSRDASRTFNERSWLPRQGSRQVKNLYIAQIKNLALAEVTQCYLKNGKLKLFVIQSILYVLMNSNIFSYWKVNLSLNIPWNVLITVFNTSSHWNRWLSEKIGQFLSTIPNWFLCPLHTITIECFDLSIA